MPNMFKFLKILSLLLSFYYKSYPKLLGKINVELSDILTSVAKFRESKALVSAGLV